jgi:putative lipoic acid-binding regulatory protein
MGGNKHGGDDNDTLLEFPVDFPLKAMGRDNAEFRAVVKEIVARHASFDDTKDVREQQSSKGKFVSITITFEATSKTQLDTIYQSLYDHELVLMIF